MTDSPNLALAEAISGLELEIEYHRKHGFPQTVERLGKALAALRAQPSGDWIPVSERFPSDLEIVQVWGTTEDEDEGWSVAQYDADGGNWHIRFDGGCVSIEIVTHWMPLPQPPALSAAKERG